MASMPRLGAALLVVGCLIAVSDASRDPGSRMTEAIMQDSPEAVAALLDEGLDINMRIEYKKQTPLMRATLRNMTKVVPLLLERGADKYIGDVDGYLPTDGAAFMGHTLILKYLLDAGMDPNLPHKDR